MPVISITSTGYSHRSINKKRVQSIDLLRGVVMIIMALDHVRDYFHDDAFVFDPTNLSRTSAALFFTRWITHFCAPIFVFLAGVSAYLSGAKKSRKELSSFLFTRGLWLVFAELFIIGLFRSFNPGYPYFNLQVIWAIGISMIALSAIIYLKRSYILLLAVVLIGAHNLLDNVHVPGDGIGSFVWALLHDPGFFTFGRFTFRVHYPLLPWVGIITFGYYIGYLYSAEYDAVHRRQVLLALGIAFIGLFILLHSGNFYGDAAVWSEQKNWVFSLLSFINVTKYPPSLLYILITLGSAFIFLSVTEKPLNKLTSTITVFGRVPMFYYMAHILLIHIFAVAGVMIQGYKWSDMVLRTSVNGSSQLKGYGFDLMVVYLVWIGLVLFLYPFCKWFDRYKRENYISQRWLSYF